MDADQAGLDCSSGFRGGRLHSLDLGLAEYVSINLTRQSFNGDSENVQVELTVAKWADYFARGAGLPHLRWCVGDGCELY